ncbi:MAG: formate--tetrahydrofolate ligase [Erysipelotrichaceae bacterium]|nr:formate--tetrahydrofolate ligase [Erysipelotrichaceae bacterium]
MTDIEIARSTKLLSIDKIASEIGLNSDEYFMYGKYKCKIDNSVYNRLKNKKNGKLILVTAISPTPLGEGKTTMSIAIADGLRAIGKKSILALREPSLGPVFGIKGGATGGGMVQVAPMEDINLHFTGDIHAITSANNLLSAMIDNHIYFGNELQFDRVVWKRCLDLNDRQLRVVNTGLSGEKGLVPRMDKFDITVASEVMAILCLSKDIIDLKRRLGKIIVGYRKDNSPIFASDLKAEGSMAVLLKDAMMPNLVQTLEHTPAIIHGGPFANIAHGCNSVVATKIALKLSDYVITEAGFGADLGAEKFLDIKCRNLDIKPDAVVIVATIKALKYHGGIPKEDITNENIEGLDKGLHNLYCHIDNIKNKFGLNVIVALNKYSHDTDKEIKYLEDKLAQHDVSLSIVTSYTEGSAGAIDIANTLVELTNKPSTLNYIYDINESIESKIEKIATKVYHAKGVIYDDKATEQIKELVKLGYDKLPICIAKTQYSLSDDPKNLECRNDYNIRIRSIEIKNGAGFIVALAGKIMTMPGLPKVPAAENITLNENIEIEGIF